MSEAEHLSRALKGMFSNTRNGWLPPFTDALVGLTAAQATWVPSPGMNSVWAVVNHVRFWHDVVLLQLQGLPVDRTSLGAESGWPPAGDPVDERAWQEACQRAALSNEGLVGYVAGRTDEEVIRPLASRAVSPWQLLHGLIGHTSYHTGQIVMIRRLQCTWEVDWRKRAHQQTP